MQESIPAALQKIRKMMKIRMTIPLLYRIQKTPRKLFLKMEAAAAPAMAVAQVTAAPVRKTK